MEKIKNFDPDLFGLVDFCVRFCVLCNMYNPWLGWMSE